MPPTYETVTRDGHTLDILTDSACSLRITVTRHGAELVGLERRDTTGKWVGFLYRDGDVSAPKEGWTNHATVMGYFTHRIKNERSTYRGHEIHGGTHSFLRHKIFEAPEVSNMGTPSLTYTLASTQIAPEEYPYKVAFTLIYSIDKDTLKVTFRFKNEEPEQSTHVSFGLHPGFAATSLESATLLMPAGKYLRHHAADNFLTGEIEEIDFAGGPMPFKKEELPGSFLLGLKNIEAPFFIFVDRESKREVMMNYSGAPYLTIWSSGLFLCVEPCWGLPDHQEQRPFEEKLGMQEIAPLATLTRSFSISPGFSH